MLEMVKDDEHKNQGSQVSRRVIKRYSNRKFDDAAEVTKTEVTTTEVTKREVGAEAGQTEDFENRMHTIETRTEGDELPHEGSLWNPAIWYAVADTWRTTSARLEQLENKLMMLQATMLGEGAHGSP